ncbi:GAP family protein [Mycobacteroides salmoniphilum]|uniref:GAP family protein n=1 Tax=Mycobacteroides salmoniphilum TaxID=404941 RepID=UPI000991EBB4|nr:GAP family protein [Mycobacteroides salmoniphilum]
MWTIVLLMALGVSVEPTRLGLTVVMLNRPRPLLQLFVFLCGAFVMGLSLGLTLLFVLRVSPMGNADVSGPYIQVGLGVLALLVAAVLAITASIRRPAAAPRAPRSGLAGKLTTRVRGFLRNNSLWVAGVSGLGIALPSADFLAVIALIHASGATQPVQSMALLFFNAVAFSMVALPLLSYAAMPARTYEMVSALHTWIRTRRRIDVAAIVAILGLIILTLGAIGILRA